MLYFIVFVIFIIALIFWGIFQLAKYIFHLIEKYRLNVFFNSENFSQTRLKVKKYITECNDLNTHIETLKKYQGIIEQSNNNKGTAVLQDNSNYNFRRENWKLYNNDPTVYNCSLQIVKNAKLSPFKYLCKYFNIEICQDSINKFSEILNDFCAVEQGKEILKLKHSDLLYKIRDEIPDWIYTKHSGVLKAKLGFEEIKLKDAYYPQYEFRYISAGGNSRSSCYINLDMQNLENFVEYMDGELSRKKSSKYQRSLMTSRLRENIKQRDNYTCCNCGISTADEAHLLLEIDHIIPISKGGLTVEDNLQTLCWKCNRSKSDKLNF